MSDPTQTFRAEAAEHIETLEQVLLELEVNPTDKEQITLAFRSMHTIKGAAGMVGYDHLSYFTHHLETLLDEVRNGSITLNSDLCQLLLQACDHISELLENTVPATEEMAVSEAMIARAKAALPDKNEQKSDAVQTVKPAAKKASATGLFRINIRPDADAFRNGFDLLPLLRELHALGPCHVSTFFAKDIDLNHFDAETCQLQCSLLLRTEADMAAINDVFIFVADDWHISVIELDNDEAFRMGDLLVQQGVVKEDEIEALLAQRPKTGELLSQQGMVNPQQVNRALAEQKYLRKQRAAAPEEQTIRVPQHKLDALMDQVGELVIMQASLDQLALTVEDTRVEALAEELARLANNLRDIAFDIRMLPIGSTFSRFRRLVRDLSRELGKEVVLETEGAETELDKVVLDKLTDPLVHILRNSMDHGIETPEVRRAADKPSSGTIKLAAWHAQGQIQIEITDDGAGLDRGRIFAKAVEKGLISESAELEDKEVFQLIFEPGFSTAATVSDVSGRGVGMDVVRSSIEALQGKVYLDSTTGKGTRLLIRLPMTLSIIDGLMVAVGDQNFVIPLNQVEECVETTHQDPRNPKRQSLIPHRDQLIGQLNLRDMFCISGERPGIQQTVIVKTGDTLLGVTVDTVIGNHQTVIRNMGRLYRETPGVMGATILGDGGIAMILDLAALAEDYASNA